MPKNKRPVPRKSQPTPEDKDDAQIRLLAQLALNLAEQEDGDAMTAQLREQDENMRRTVRKALSQKNDEVLYAAIERARDEDVGAYQLLRGVIEDAAGTMLVRRDGAPTMEINAFVIPLFVHSTGGLRQEQEFDDQDSFEALVASIQGAGLESAEAKVVLMRHFYAMSEIDGITYSHLHEMVRDAHASMTEKKLVATPALERSVGTWPDGGFGPGDAAVELRFLLGFALKRADDPFYVVPADEAAADAYFAARMARYLAWTASAAELVKRCLAPAGSALELSFLYQDVFHGAKEQGMAEYFMLQMMAEINQALDRHGIDPAAVKVVLAPADVRGSMVLRANLYRASDDTLLASPEKPLDLGADLEVEVDDVAEALATIGVSDLAVALRFDQHGQPLQVQPYAAH